MRNHNSEVRAPKWTVILLDAANLSPHELMCSCIWVSELHKKLMVPSFGLDTLLFHIVVVREVHHCCTIMQICWEYERYSAKQSHRTYTSHKFVQKTNLWGTPRDELWIHSWLNTPVHRGVIHWQNCRWLLSELLEKQAKAIRIPNMLIMWVAICYRTSQGGISFSTWWFPRHRTL